MNKYKIIDIVHSGRKGIRGEKVTQSKYEALVGCIAYIDLDAIKPFQSVHMILKGHPDYDWWDTSVLLSFSLHEGYMEIETANSIYVFEEVND